MLQEEKKKRIQKEAQQLVETGTAILQAQVYRLRKTTYSGKHAEYLNSIEEKFPLHSSYQDWFSKCLPFLTVLGTID